MMFRIACLLAVVGAVEDAEAMMQMGKLGGAAEKMAIGSSKASGVNSGYMIAGNNGYMTAGNNGSPQTMAPTDVATTAIVGAPSVASTAPAGAVAKTAVVGVSSVRDWWLHLPEKPKKVFSQNDEDGILEFLFEHLGTTNKRYVEFGTETGVEINTRLLREDYGWSGLLMDGGNGNLTIGLHKEMIFPWNVVGLFKKYNVESELDLLSIDVDSFDLEITRVILAAGYRPRVLVVEVNAAFGDHSMKSYPPQRVTGFGWMDGCGQTCTFDSGKSGPTTSMCGAGAAAVNFVGGVFGYQSVYLNSVNLFLVREDLLPSVMKQSWTWERVLARSTPLGRQHHSFPRRDCNGLIGGLVEASELNMTAGNKGYVTAGNHGSSVGNNGYMTAGNNGYMTAGNNAL